MNAGQLGSSEATAGSKQTPSQDSTKSYPERTIKVIAAGHAQLPPLSDNVIAATVNLKLPEDKFAAKEASTKNVSPFACLAVVRALIGNIARLCFYSDTKSHATVTQSS